MMEMKPHQLLLLLLLLMLFIAHFPNGSSAFIFDPPRLMPEFRMVRRQANAGQPDGWSQVNAKSYLVERVVTDAAKKADVTPTQPLQAFQKVC